MSEWQPIETAPRDGTVVLLWATDAPACEMYWDPAGRNLLVQSGPGIWTHPSGELTWSEQFGAGPTHWMPCQPPAPRITHSLCGRA